MESKIYRFSCRLTYLRGKYRCLRKLVYAATSLELHQVRTNMNGHVSPATPSAKEHFAWLGKLTPCFGINGRQVEVIRHPSVFYKSMLNEISKANDRIVIASLYLGTSPLEEDLVKHVYDAAAGKFSAMTKEGDEGGVSKPTVEILLDYTRGSRGAHNSRTMLVPLLRDFPDQVKVSLFHSPDLRGIWKSWLPERYNEIPGLHHMKIYIFDDNVLLSGANLSESYFTNRQDRYVIIRRCRPLADYFQKLVSGVASLSFNLNADDSVNLSQDLQNHPFEGPNNGEAYRAEAKQRIQEIIDPSKYTDFTNGSQSGSEAASEVIDTWIYPTVQMAAFGISQDDHVTLQLFQRAPQQSHIKVASGYFNLTDHYMNSILTESAASFNILTACPEANGFYGGKGVSGYIPDTYTCIAKQFLDSVFSLHQQERIHLQEYRQEGWTFHGKGLWYYLPHNILPCMSLIGSPNFGYRSVFRDLEAQAVIVTENTHLQKQLHLEQHELYSKSSPVEQPLLTERMNQIPLWVKCVTPIIKRYF